MSTRDQDSLRYQPVPAQVDLPALEHAILQFWREHDTFHKSLDQTADGPRWTFYEGPPTANGVPGTHHVEARVFKDVFPRFRTMRGYQIERKAGWDCHGLPIELAVEKELGFSGKGEIEQFGIAEFNAMCREHVMGNVDAFTAMTERMGYWVDMDEPYQTMDTTYIESVWWSLKQIHSRGLLVEDYRVAPYCPRCGTTLSEHELGQEGGYETVADPSVFVRFPLTSGPYARQAALLVWTTTPWTLVSNTAVAAHPRVDYVVATDGNETLVVAEPLFDTVLGPGWTVTSRLRGSEMERWTYQRPFELVAFDQPAHFVVIDDYVSTEDGTGLVHQSPAFGPDDLRVCREYGLPLVGSVGLDGRFHESIPLVGGQFFKHADRDLVADLAERGLLFRHVSYEHSYPHCWRCHTPLMYYAQPSWYIRTTAIKQELLRENEKTNWFPETIKWGRYGDWLENNVDWALSRKRYWGTPLPIWRCEARHETCVESRAELGALAGQDLSRLDPHRPYVDEVVLSCPSCGETARRVPEVIDAWYDSGSMPFAQWGYPHVEGSKALFDAAYPAQFIAEAIDQTRGWFYTLMAVGTLVFDASSYENVLCLGLIVAEDGRKMSKHLGNILEPMPLMERHGADAVRWFMLASGSPWAERRVGHAALQEIVRKVLLTYWNTVAFQVLYARAADWSPGGDAPAAQDRPVLDRWLLSETARLTATVTESLESFETQRAGQLLGAFVDDLSNWYVRRSRRRFWNGDTSALTTLHEALNVLTRLLAPMTPFIAERVWQDIIRTTEPAAAESVHLSEWPRSAASEVDNELAAEVALARRITELGRAARSAAKVRTRQPLRRALIASTSWQRLSEEMRTELCEELNIGSLAPLSAAGADLIEYSVKPNYRALGSRFGPATPAVATAINTTDPRLLATQLADGGTAGVTVDGELVDVTDAEVMIAERPLAGWSVINEQGETVALDLEIRPDLVRAGLAREMVRFIQDARKQSGFEVTDRIGLRWEPTAQRDPGSPTGDEVVQTMDEHEQMIAGEVLATSVTGGPPDDAEPDWFAYTDETVGVAYWLRRQ
jgi:isoleucyl-tRNA synthetase